MYTSIVVPLDGSEFGNCALPVALTLATRGNASVHLVHVRPPVALPSEGLTGLREYDDPERELRTNLMAMAGRLARARTLRVDAQFLDGPVVPALRAYFSDRQHDLVVMMTHGRGGLSRAWFGNVADGLIRHAPIPLLLLRRQTARLSDATEPLFRRILLPLDGSVVAEQVLDHVLSLATPDVTVFVLLTVIAASHALESTAADPEGSAARAHDERELWYLDRVADELRTNGALVETHVETHQQAAQGILDAADVHQVDLIALSTHGRGSLSRLVHGSVADTVVRGAPVPVLICRPEHLDSTSVLDAAHSADPQPGLSMRLQT